MEEQTELRFATRGGKRAGAGRKRTRYIRARVPHRARPAHHHAYPVHVTLRMRPGLPSMRSEGVLAEVRAAIRGANHSPAVGAAFRVIEFSLQENHAHFIVEAHDKETLSRGLRGMAIRLARAVNRAMGFRGSVWGDRYHARDLKTPRAVRTAIVYVLMNAKKHRVTRSNIDIFSSAPWFRGFHEAIEMPREESPATSPRTWLASAGWRKRGLVRLREEPRAPD